jgi:hypothetical protein
MVVHVSLSLILKLRKQGLQSRHVDLSPQRVRLDGVTQLAKSFVGLDRRASVELRDLVGRERQIDMKAFRKKRLLAKACNQNTQVRENTEKTQQSFHCHHHDMRQLAQLALCYNLGNIKLHQDIYSLSGRRVISHYVLGVSLSTFVPPSTQVVHSSQICRISVLVAC